MLLIRNKLTGLQYLKMLNVKLINELSSHPAHVFTIYLTVMFHIQITRDSSGFN